jgi:hypothetical protein
MKGKRKMKKLTKYKTMIFILAILFIAPFTGFAADTWSETPALNHESETESVASVPAILKHVNPPTEMLAETPDLLVGNEDNEAPIHDRSKTADAFNPEQYVETSDF